MNMPIKIQPMLAKTGTLPKDWENWGFEFKWDGIRAVMYWNGKNIKIESRNLLDITFRYPELADAGRWLQSNAVIDGEIIALEHGVPSFSRLQKRMLVSENKMTKSLLKIKIQYYIFDLLYLNDQNLMNLFYEQRRQHLESLNIAHPDCRISPGFKGRGQTILSIAKEHRLEGVICKKLKSFYTPGKRSLDWIKVKIVKSAEFIICGFKYGKNTKDRIGSLQLAVYDEKNKLRYVGGVGTGFDAVEHKILLSKLETLQKIDNPFDINLKDVVFIEPKLIAQVEYRRWPKNEILQQASYKGLRFDKLPEEITLKEQQNAR